MNPQQGPLFNMLYSTLQNNPAEQEAQSQQMQNPAAQQVGQEDPQQLMQLLSPQMPDTKVSQASASVPFNRQASMAQDAAIADPLGKTPLAAHGAALDGHEYDGLCEKWAEKQVYGKTGIFPSAMAAFNANAQAGNITSSKDPPKGAQVFFNSDESNGNFGHTGVSLGGGKFESATYNGIKVFSIPDWEKNTGQVYIGATPSPTK